MQTEMRLLTRREKSREHVETLLVIDWTGVTHDELVKLASWAITQEVQARIYKDPLMPAEKTIVSASAIAKDKPVMVKRFSPPEPKAPKMTKDMQALLDMLSPEELATLLGGSDNANATTED